MDNFGFLDFKAISLVPFEKVLKTLEISYREENGKLITDTDIISVDKNLFFEKAGQRGDKKGGSVIQFVSEYKHCSLRAAAFFIKELCGVPAKEEHKIPELTLHYHPHLAEIAPEDLCKGLNVGFCKGKSIMAGHICFKVGAHYIGYNPDKKTWLFPKNFKVDTLWNIENCDQDTIIVVVNPFDALFLVAQGISNTAALLRDSMTSAQGELLKGYKRVLLFHDEPLTAERLLRRAFVKVVPAINRPTKEQIDALI
jgi:hypothetical protein